MSPIARGPLSEERAEGIVLAAQSAWNRRDLRALASLYTEDLVYWCNWGGPENGPRSLQGRQEYIRHLSALRDTADIEIRLVSFALRGDRGKALFQFSWRDPGSGMLHVASSRNVITFAGDRIARIEVYQDAAAMQAFQALVGSHRR